MNKRELVKWLEKEKENALVVAKETKDKMIDSAAQKEYDSIALDDFIAELSVSYQSIVNSFDELIKRCENKKISVSKYHWKLNYTTMLTYASDPDSLRSYVSELVYIDTEDFVNAMREAIKYYNSVEQTYDYVIQTVKNLPTAKDGLEYLKKLGFNTKSIMPIEQKKQLPATISVNVDTRYLILNNKK